MDLAVKDMEGNMPGFDGTGPEGKGPMTGGRRGRCVGNRRGLSRPETEPANEGGVPPTGGANVEDMFSAMPPEPDMVLGVGRGGVPRGGGRGRCFGGGRNRRPMGGSFRRRGRRANR